MLSCISYAEYIIWPPIILITNEVLIRGRSTNGELKMRMRAGSKGGGA